MFSNIKAARLLGWTSLAVGLTEILATQWLEDEMGVEGHKTLIRSFGVREIAAGFSILSQPGLNKTLAASLWGRVVGDAADLAALGKATQETKNSPGLTAITSVVMAVTAVDVVVAALTQRDLIRTATVSTAARQRVQPTAARPDFRATVEADVAS